MVEFLLNILSGGIIGAIASYTASVYFQKKNNEKNLPQLQMSDVIIERVRSNDAKTPAIELKLVNFTDKDISNIKLEMEGLRNLAPNGSIPLIDLKKISHREILSIKKYDKNDDHYFHNAHRIYLFNDADIIKDIKTFDYIRISASVMSLNVLPILFTPFTCFESLKSLLKFSIGI